MTEKLDEEKLEKISKEIGLSTLSIMKNNGIHTIPEMVAIQMATFAHIIKTLQDVVGDNDLFKKVLKTMVEIEGKNE